MPLYFSMDRKGNVEKFTIRLRRALKKKNKISESGLYLCGVVILIYY